MPASCHTCKTAYAFFVIVGVYTYDAGGNITSKKEYDYTTGTVGTALSTQTYTYGDSSWKDLLTKYNGTTLSYDTVGNLTGDGTWSYTWVHGRQLAGMSRTGASLSFAYDADGQRISKTADGVTTQYYYAGDRLTHLTKGTKSLHFDYDSIGPRSVVYDTGSSTGTYYYLRNAQGDVLGIVNNAGAVVVSYTYDAWGNLLGVTGDMADGLGALNPLRYRGYVYDTETGLYYLGSRYYNPAWGRFINADTPTVTLMSPGSATWDKNLFAYCDNDPVNRKDDGGQFWNVVIGAAVGALVGTISSIATQAIENKGFSNINWGRVGLSAVSGAISGGLAATGILLGGQVIANATIGAVSSAVDTRLKYGEKATFSDYAVNTLVGGAVGTISGLIGGNGTGTKHIANSFKRLLSNGNVRYYFSQTNTEAVRSGIKAITPIVKSAIPGLIRSML